MCVITKLRNMNNYSILHFFIHSNSCSFFNELNISRTKRGVKILNLSFFFFFGCCLLTPKEKTSKKKKKKMEKLI
jgi:hypothetical protein